MQVGRTAADGNTMQGAQRATEETQRATEEIKGSAAFAAHLWSNDLTNQRVPRIISYKNAEGKIYIHFLAFSGTSAFKINVHIFI